MNAKQAQEAALRYCRGAYQRAVVSGDQCWSGADLRGRAADFAGHYARSRRALLARLHAAGIPVRIATGAHGRKHLVWGDEE